MTESGVAQLTFVFVTKLPDWLNLIETHSKKSFFDCFMDIINVEINRDWVVIREPEDECPIAYRQNGRGINKSQYRLHDPLLITMMTN